MPVIDIRTPAGLLDDAKVPRLLDEAGQVLLRHEGVPAAPPYSPNAGDFLDVLNIDHVRTVAEMLPAVVRVDVLTPPGALTRTGIQAVVADLTALVQSVVRPDRPVRVWVLVRETVDGGWGVDGFAPTTAELREVAARRGAVSPAGQP